MRMKSINSITHSQELRRIPFERPILAAHQPEFLPWLGFISKAAMGDIFLLLDSVQYEKQNWQNRNKIRTRYDCGWKWLIIPLIRESTSREKKISDARMARGSWREEHLRAIKNSYSKAPFFSETFNQLEKSYQYDGDSLSEFNASLIQYAFRMFQIDAPVYRTSDLISSGYSICGRKTDIILSMCQAVGARTYVSGPFGKGYLDTEIFRLNNINLVFQSFDHPVYPQIHGEFIPCMSFIDLLFNHGPKSIEILGKPNWELG
jgi:hypothetical protein